jgi:hypothetical protein
MRGERGLLRTGEFLVALAARRLPAGVRDERYQEWTAELLAIVRDPSLRPAWRRAAGMLGYALDTIRATALRPGQDRHRGAHRGSDPRAAVKTARWLALLCVALAGLLAFLSLSLLLVYLASSATGLGLWAASSVRSRRSRRLTEQTTECRSGCLQARVGPGPECGYHCSRCTTSPNDRPSSSGTGEINAIVAAGPATWRAAWS